jgi:hypothetical protein
LLRCSGNAGEKGQKKPSAVQTVVAKKDGDGLKTPSAEKPVLLDGSLLMRLGLPFDRHVVVVLRAGLVACNLTVELVGEFVYSGVEVCVGAFGKYVAALDVHSAFGSLASFLFLHVVNGEKDLHIHDLIKMPGDPVQFGRHVAAQGGRNLEVVAADRQIHRETPIFRMGLSKGPG